MYIQCRQSGSGYFKRYPSLLFECGLLLFLVHISFAYFFLIFRSKHSQAQYTQKHKHCLYHSVILRYIEGMSYIISDVTTFSRKHIFKKLYIFNPKYFLQTWFSKQVIEQSL